MKTELGVEFRVSSRLSVSAQYSLLEVSDRIAWQNPNTVAPQMARFAWLNSQSAGTLGLNWHF